MPPLYVYSDKLFDWPGHVFPTRKYHLLRERLLADPEARTEDFVAALPALPEQLRRVHTADYLERLARYAATDPMAAIHEIEAPLNAATWEAILESVGGSILAARLALRHGYAMNLGGGFHHAFADRGEGFCAINDIAVAIEELRASDSVRRVAVIDLDVHQGNGTARIFQGDPDVFTFSMHQENNYPAKEISDLDIGLHDGATDDEYLEALRRGLAVVERKNGPELIVYVAGADAYRHDRLGGLGCSLDGLQERDRVVLDWADRLGVPVMATLAGGYAERVEDVVEIHYRLARAMRERRRE